jgi:predicted component of type VI protein secretion system
MVGEQSIRDPYDPASIIPTLAESFAGELSSPSAAGHPTDHRPMESLPPHPVQALLDGMGLNHAADAHFGHEQLRLAGRLLRSFSDGMVRLLATYRTTAAGLGLEPDHEIAHQRNPFFVFPSGDRVVMALFQQPLSGFTHPENAVDQVFAALETSLHRMASGENERVDAVLQRLGPRQLELEVATSGIHAGDGTQLVSASWRQHFGSPRGNTNPGTQPMYAPQWGHRQ